MSLTYATIEGASSSDVVYYAANAYWTPAETGSFPSISVGYEKGDPEATTGDTSHYFVGLQWDEVGPGTFGAALGTTGHTVSDATSYIMYEAFYSYPINDGMTVTPLVYVKEASGNDQTGILVKTSFSF